MRDVVGKKMEFVDRISLCKNARSTSLQNASIVKGCDKKHGAIIEFCRTKVRHSSIAPNDGMPLKAVQCVLSAPSKLTDDEKLQLCSGASSSAPGECMKQAIKKISQTVSCGSMPWHYFWQRPCELFFSHHG